MESLPKIQKVSVSDQVFDLLKSYIADGKIKPGEKLPSENELCAMLGVSRPPVNAAVNRLRAMGLVEVRAGDGSYVKRFDSMDYIQTYADLVMGTEDIPEILEIRRALDVEGFRLAMDRATETDLQELQEITDRFVHAQNEKDYETAADMDFAFHRHICKCSKNRYFLMMYELIGGLLRKQMQLFRVSQNRRAAEGSKIIDDHIKMYQALRDKDFDLYISVLAEHTNYASHMEQN